MRYRKNILRDKSFLAMAGITVLAVAAIAGGMMLSKNSTENETESSYIADLNETDNMVANNEPTKSPGKSTSANQQSSGSETTASEAATTVAEAESTSGSVSEAGANVSPFFFSVDSKLIWPVETTDIVIEFSPDSTIYFPTLDKYKTSDAISIRSQVDTPVYAASAGMVKDIGYNEEIGNSISLDLGNNYILQYGQIKDIQVAEGDSVKEGDLLCYVATPTKYYSVEGPNLYLKLSCDEKAVDPLDYLDY